MSTSPQPPPAGRRRTRPGRPGGSALAALFDPGLDRNAIERMTLAFAVHPEGPGFARVHLLAWNPDRESFEGRLCWTRRTQARAMESAVAAAKRLATDGTDPDATRLLRALRFALDDLNEDLRRIWLGGRSGISTPDDVLQPWNSAAAIGAVPLRCDGRGFALLVGEWGEVPDGDRRLDRLEALRAIANAALTAQATRERSRRAEARAAAVATFARASVSSMNLAEASNLIVRLACENTAARGAVLWLASGSPAAAGADLTPTASYGPAGTRDRIARALHPLAAACVADGRARAVDRPHEEPALPAEVAAQISSVVVVPLIAYGKTLGAIGVHDRVAQHPSDGAAFEAEDVGFLSALADQCALAWLHAGVEDERRRAEEARRDLLRQLGRSERTAAQAETSARVAREARNPVASIAAFSRRVYKSLGENDPNREYLEVIVREAERLERALSGQIEMAPADAPRLQVENVNTLLQAALQQAGEQMVRRRVRLIKRLSSEVPALLLDTARMGGAFRNLLEHALDRIGPGGRLRVETRRLQQFVVVEIAHDGRSDPGQLIEDLFVPFQLQGGPETAVGAARQIVLEHGGEVRVKAAGEWSTIFLLTFPVGGNEDRRRPSSERRVTRNDRRQRYPAA